MFYINTALNFTKVITLFVLFCFSMKTSSVLAEDYFPLDFIEIRNNITRDVDISYFRKADGQIPGTYHVDVYLNGNYIESLDVIFQEKKSVLSPLLTYANFVKWGVKRNAQPGWINMKESTTIDDIDQLLPGSSIIFQFDEMRLAISVPQEYMQRDARGSVSPVEWDDGVNMFFLNYTFSAANNSGKSLLYNNSYLNVRSGGNVGPWRLRNYSTYSNNEGDALWNSLSTSLERDIKFLKSQFSIGDGYTPAGVFDSVHFRGVQMYSDDTMLPESVRGYAPVVRGIAQSNAQVTIWQGGNIIWQSYVPPGPFIIDDLYPTSASGDLTVVVRESDGTEHQFTQPFSMVPIMQREGQFKYSVAAGKYVSSINTDKTPEFIQSTMSYGLPWEITIYGGTLVSGDYWAGALGIGKGLGDLGSLSFDSTLSYTKSPEKTERGISFRTQYAKEFSTTGTSMNLMGYRYSSSGFHDFQESNRNASKNITEHDNSLGKDDLHYMNNRRSKAQMTLNQQLGDFGNINLSVWHQDYWGGDSERNVSFGYNTSVYNINYGLNYSYSRNNLNNNNDHLIAFMMQIPLSNFLPNSWMTTSVNANKKGEVSSQLGLSGSALQEGILSWNIQQGYDSKGSDITGSASANYKGRHGEYQFGYNYSRDNHQMSLGTSGGIVIHPYGITTTPPLGETMALVKAENAVDLKVVNNGNLYTDSKGFAVVPYVAPYRQNSLTLSTSNLNNTTDILNDTRTVVPSKGALVLADFPTVTGYRIMLKLTGKTIPFGATAKINNSENASEGIVDDHQRVWLSGVQEKGSVLISWTGGTCQANYQILKPTDKTNNVTAECK
ncbi:fimbria/pilus outer membrane usher protein [Escherichia coli]|uniref:fimbria/pilus outer membrane usher protein n=1 Tax=Escherichia coli TaxID=562 RepID=UPI0038B52463